MSFSNFVAKNYSGEVLAQRIAESEQAAEYAKIASVVEEYMDKTMAADGIDGLCALDAEMGEVLAQTKIASQHNEIGRLHGEAIIATLQANGFDFPKMAGLLEAVNSKLDHVIGTVQGAAPQAGQ